MPSSRTNNQRRWPKVTVTVLLTTLLLVIGAHAYAQSLEERARDRSLTPPERVAAGRRAVAIEPWNDRFALSLTIAEAHEMVSEGRVDEAYFRLLPYSQIRDEQLRMTYQDVLKLKWPLDARKAHQQHAKEQEDGALADEDVFK